MDHHVQAAVHVDIKYDIQYLLVFDLTWTCQYIIPSISYHKLLKLTIFRVFTTHDFKYWTLACSFLNLKKNIKLIGNQRDHVLQIQKVYFEVQRKGPTKDKLCLLILKTGISDKTKKK